MIPGTFLERSAFLFVPCDINFSSKLIVFVTEQFSRKTYSLRVCQGLRVGILLMTWLLVIGWVARHANYLT